MDTDTGMVWWVRVLCSFADWFDLGLWDRRRMTLDWSGSRILVKSVHGDHISGISLVNMVGNGNGSVRAWMESHQYRWDGWMPIQLGNGRVTAI